MKKKKPLKYQSAILLKSRHNFKLPKSEFTHLNSILEAPALGLGTNADRATACGAAQSRISII